MPKYLYVYDSSFTYFLEKCLEFNSLYLFRIKKIGSDQVRQSSLFDFCNLLLVDMDKFDMCCYSSSGQQTIRLGSHIL